MTSARNCRNWLLWSLSAALLVLPAHAADKAGKDQTKRLQQQLRKAEQEKTQLVQQKAEVEGQLKDAREKAAEAERRVEAAAQRGSRLNKELGAIKAENEALASTSKAELAALSAKLAEMERKLAEQRQEKQTLDAAFARQKTALSVCTERNAALHKLGNEVLDQYEQKGCLTSLLQAEPFTQLQRVKMENLIEDYRDKLDASKVER